MKLLLLLFALVSPLRQVEYLKVRIEPADRNIFQNYANGNFSQKVEPADHSVLFALKGKNFLHMNLNFRISLDRSYLAKMPESVKQLVFRFKSNSVNLKDYMTRVKDFLQSNIKYSATEGAQDSHSVLRFKKANCIGFSNLVADLLGALGVRAAQVKGFFLKKTRGSAPEPVPHRWLEIRLKNGFNFFFDPQYQDFSSWYILVNPDTDFRRVKKFKVKLLERNKKLVNYRG